MSARLRCAVRLRKPCVYGTLERGEDFRQMRTGVGARLNPGSVQCAVRLDREYRGLGEHARFHHSGPRARTAALGKVEPRLARILVIQSVADAQARQTPVAHRRLGAFMWVAGKRDHRDAAPLEFGQQAVQLTEPGAAVRAVASMIEDDQLERRRMLRRQAPGSTLDALRFQRGHGVVRNRSGQHGGLRPTNMIRA